MDAVNSKKNDIDIERLRIFARFYKDKTMLTLLGRLEKAEAQRDRLAEALREIVSGIGYAKAVQAAARALHLEDETDE